MAVCSLSLHVGSSESCKTIEQKFIFLAFLISTVLTSGFHSPDLFLFSCHRGKHAWSSTTESLPVYASPLISQIYNIFATASKCREINRHSAQWPPLFQWPYSFRGNFTRKEYQERRLELCVHETFLKTFLVDHQFGPKQRERTQHIQHQCISWLFIIPLRCKGISRCATVFSESESVLISLVCHLKCLVLGVCDVPLKVLQVNSQHDVISIRQTVKIVVSEPELAAKTSEPLFVSFPVTIEVNRAVQTSLENGPTSTVSWSCHTTLVLVYRHLDWWCTRRQRWNHL